MSRSPRKGSHAICFVLVVWLKSMSANDKPGPKTSRMVSSIEFCSRLLDASDIGRGLSRRGGHRAMIPPLPKFLALF